MSHKYFCMCIFVVGLNVFSFITRAAAQVRLEVKHSKLIFGNDYIERAFEEDSWQTVSLRNVRTGGEYDFPDAEDVALEFADINSIHQEPRQVETVPLKRFTYQGRELQEAREGGKKLLFFGNWQGIDLVISYELLPQWFYMKKSIQVTNTRPEETFLLTVYLESLRNQFAGKYVTDMMAKVFRWTNHYKSVHRVKDCFNLMEYPGGVEAMFDLKYFPGKFLAPGQQYASYPAVTGMTAADQLEFELRKYAYDELYWYGGVAPHNYGSWLLHLNWDGTPDNIYPHLQKSPNMGIKLFIVDARLDGYSLKSNDREQWLEYELPERKRFPDGLEGFLEQTRIAGLRIGYYLRTAQLIRGRPSWMIDNPHLPSQYKSQGPLKPGNYAGPSDCSCFAHQPYEEYFRNYTMNLIKNYEADFFHFDWFGTFPCNQPNHNHLPNGWDAFDKQNEAFMRVLAEMRSESPAIVLQSGGGCLSVHWMKWLSHSFIHDIFPGPNPDLSYTRSCGAVSRQRLHRYAKDGFCPMMLISDWADAGGELTKNPFGWKDSFFNSIALTPSLRLEAGLHSYGCKELAWMKKWLDWRATHTQGYSNVRFVWGHPFRPGTEGYSFIDNSQGYLYFVNNEYADNDISVRMDASVGITDQKQQLEVRFLYPIEAVLSNQGKPHFKYGDTIQLHLPFKTIRYLSVLPHRGSSELPIVDDMPADSGRWVVTTRDITSKPLDQQVRHTAQLSLADKELPEKNHRPGSVDTSIKLNMYMVNEDPADQVYLMLCGEKIRQSNTVPDNPFAALRVWVNNSPVGGTIKSQKRLWPPGENVPFFYSDVTGVIQPDKNTIQWETSKDAVKVKEVILVREADEQVGIPSKEGNL